MSTTTTIPDAAAAFQTACDRHAVAANAAIEARKALESAQRAKAEMLAAAVSDESVTGADVLQANDALRHAEAALELAQSRADKMLESKHKAEVDKWAADAAALQGDHTSAVLAARDIGRQYDSAKSEADRLLNLYTSALKRVGEAHGACTQHDFQLRQYHSRQNPILGALHESVWPRAAAYLPQANNAFPKARLALVTPNIDGSLDEVKVTAAGWILSIYGNLIAAFTKPKDAA